MANRPVDPNAREALNKMKMEIANELGLRNDDIREKGSVTSKENGYYGGSLGGTMTRRLIEIAERELVNKNK